MRRMPIVSAAALLTLVTGCTSQAGGGPAPDTVRAMPSSSSTSVGVSGSPSPPERVPEQTHESEAFAALPAGRRPRVALVLGRYTLVDRQQAPRSLPRPMAQVAALAPLGDGWLVASRTGGDGRSPGMSTAGYAAVTRLDAALRPRWTRWGAGGFAADASGSVASFTVPDRPESPGRLELLGVRGGVLRRWSIPFQQVAVPLGVTSHAQVVYALTTARGRSLGGWVTTGSGGSSAPRHLPLRYVDAAAGDLVAGRLRDGCAVVLRVVDGAELWRSCEGYKPAAFSPDARYLAAWHTATGGELETAYVLDAVTGHRVTDTSIGSPPGFHGLASGPISWEDSRHVLVGFHDGLSNDRELLRLSLDGRLERTGGAVSPSGAGPAFVLADGPGTTSGT